MTTNVGSDEEQNFFYLLLKIVVNRASLVAQLEKNLLAMWKTWV